MNFKRVARSAIRATGIEVYKHPHDGRRKLYPVL
jgi:hypothetical protein